MAKLRVGVVGATGTSGAVATRLVLGHPMLSLAFATSDRAAGASVAETLGTTPDSGARFTSHESVASMTAACDAVLLATSAEVSARLAPLFADDGKQVVDLSGAFRLDADGAKKWYGIAHAPASWLERAHYGLPELFGAPAAPALAGQAPALAGQVPALAGQAAPVGGKAGALVSNPGCYPTAALLALGPLVRAGLVEPDGIIIDAKSGVTGAGRQTGDAYSFLEVDGDVRAYKVLAHQHTPEIERALSRFAPGIRVTFTAHLLPIARGLLATCYARPRAGVTAGRVKACLADAYAAAPFVRAVPIEDVRLKRVVGTNLALVGASANEDVVIAIGAIDNLLKGAAGQAVQNLNLMNGWDPALGLQGLQRAAA